MLKPDPSIRHPKHIPSLVYADAAGNILDLPDVAMGGRSGNTIIAPEPDDLIPLPPESELFLLPSRLPVGFDRKNGNKIVLTEDPGPANSPVQAVAAFMSPAYTSLLLSAYETGENGPQLPLFAYTAVGWLHGRFWVAGFRSDPDTRQDFSWISPERIEKKTRRKLSQNPDNRLIQHIGSCCLQYGCPAAKNYFLGRLEAPLPTSPLCNAQCIGCISLQPSACCPSTQERITFVPTVDEIVTIAAPHLENATKPVVSFGQGCEGEPLLQAETLARAIQKIRRSTEKGTVNCNSNAGLPDAVQMLADAGLDSLRVSMNSARKKNHALYYRSTHFSLDDVRASIRIMKQKKRFVSLNYFIFPGVTDTDEECRALFQLLDSEKPDMIQLRNLNLDPEIYLEAMGTPCDARGFGMKKWLAALSENFPDLRLGYFNPSLK